MKQKNKSRDEIKQIINQKGLKKFLKIAAKASGLPEDKLLDIIQDHAGRGDDSLTNVAASIKNAKQKNSEKLEDTDIKGEQGDE